MINFSLSADEVIWVLLALDFYEGSLNLNEKDLDMLNKLVALFEDPNGGETE